MEDLVCGLNAAIEIITRGEETKYRHRLYSWATRLYHCVVSRGPELATRMRAAKDYFTLCRFNAISGSFSSWKGYPSFPYRPGIRTIDRRTLLHQVSRISRSLRKAGTEVISESLESHWKLASSEFKTPGDLKVSFRNYCLSRFSGEVVGSIGSVKPSSSFLRKKADGGAPEEIREITDNFRGRLFSHLDACELARSAREIIPPEFKIVNAEFFRSKPDESGRRVAFERGILPKFRGDEVFFPYPRELEMGLEDWEVQREVLFCMLACYDAIDMGQLPKCKQVPVAERGWKCRVVTPLEAPFRYLLGVVNTALLGNLEKAPQLVSALHGRPAEKLDWSLGKRRNMVFSADLKSATDYFPQDLMLVAAEALSEGWPPVWRQLFLRAVGPHEMTSHDGRETQVTCRGILMGSPVSWPLLSIYSAWLHKLSKSDGWFAVCGDDYIGCHTEGTYRRYLRHRARTGAVGSPGKDVLGRDGVGVFAEELVSVGRCRWIPTVSVRAVLADPKSGQPAWSQGPEVSAALDVLGWDSRTSGKVCARLHKRVYRILRRVGVSPVGPRWVGCAGFPGVPEDGVLVRARRMVSQNSEQVINWVTNLEMAWSQLASFETLASIVQQDVEGHADSVSRVPTLEVGQWGPLRDVVSSRIGSLAWSYYLAGAVKFEQRVSLSRVSKVIARVSREITDRGRWLPEDSEVTFGEGIVRRLQEMEPKCRPIPFRDFKLTYTLTLGRVDQPPRRPREPTGPGSPNWGARKRARLV